MKHKWRAPEEYLDRPLDEKIDIWSLGNNMYSLLTGSKCHTEGDFSQLITCRSYLCTFLNFLVYPFYDSKYEDVSRKVSEGLTGFIDPRYMNRSFAEAKLAEVIPQCWIYDARQRIDIIQLVDFLRIAVRQNSEREGLLQQLANISERNKILIPSQ